MNAEKIYRNGTILTIDESHPAAEAVAVADGKILAVGTEAEVLAYQSADTQMIDLGGKTMAPGFIDCHNHIGLGALLADWANVQAPPYGPADTIPHIQEAIKAYIENNSIQPGDWAIGFGYSHMELKEERHPNKSDLDAISTEHPILLWHSTLHYFTANSMALERIGINAETIDPAGGHIQRLPGSQEPNGVCEGETRWMALAKLPLGGPEGMLKRLAKVQEQFISYGVTTMQEGAASPRDMQIFQAAAAHGLLKADLAFYAIGNREESIADETLAKDHYENHLRMAGIKMVADGSFFGTIKLSTPWNVPPEGQAADFTGLMYVTEEEMRAFIRLAFESGQPLMIHTSGDACIQTFLNAYAAEAKACRVDLSKRRDVLLHAIVFTEAQADQAKELNLIVSFIAPRISFPGNKAVEDLYGYERLSHVCPVRYAVDRGIPYTLHVDYPILPPHMLMLMFAAVTRTSIADPGKVYGPELRITPTEALKAITIHAAYQYGEENQKGSITVGKLADLVILDRNPLSVDPMELMKVKVLETIKEGKTIFTLQD